MTVDHVLSARARQVLHETVGRTATANGTRLDRIQRILGSADAGVAEAVVLELDAAGYVQNYGEGKLIRIRASPIDPDVDRFVREIQQVAAEITTLATAMDTDEPGAPQETRSAELTGPTHGIADWVAAQGHRAETMLEIAVERGWFPLACTFGKDLARLRCAAGQPDEALTTLSTAEAAERGQYSQSMATLEIGRARVLSDHHRHDNAETAATAAIAYALEAAAAPGLVESAYTARAVVRERAGNPAWAVADRRQAAIAASPDRTGDYSPDLAARKAQETDHRYVVTMHSLHMMISSHVGQGAGTVSSTDAFVALVEEALFDLRQADPTGKHIALAIRTARDLLSLPLAAEIAEVVGRAAQRHSLYAVARESFRDSVELYQADGNTMQARRVGELLTRIGVVPNGPGFTRSN